MKIFFFNILLISLILDRSVSVAQNETIKTQGVVRFEKTVNTYALIKKMLGKNPQPLDLQKFELYQKTQPQFKVLKGTLTFTDDSGIYTPEESEVNVNPILAVPMTDQNNIVFTNFANRNIIEQKGIFGGFLLLQDSVRKIKWKITDETREIAGYVCRRANAIVLDSIYVVAFYTDDIHVSGGPESFSGLPGMILEIALPHDNVTWKASEVTILSNPLPSIVPPNKGRKVNYKQLIETIKSLLKGKPTAQADLLLKDLSL